VRIIGLAATLVAAVAGFGALSGETRANGNSPKISDQVLRDTAGGREASFVIFLNDQADLSAAYGMRDQNARGWYVFRTLREHAKRTQAPVLAQLRSHGVAYRSFWAANVVVAEGGRALVEDLAGRSDVKAIESDDKSNWIQDTAPPINFDSVAALEAASPDRVSAPDAVEWGVNDVHAPALWSAGYTGQGIVVASADTGVRWTHSALKGEYRGWNGTTADHNYNWHDAVHGGGGVCGPDSLQPCDDDSHGTHTTGSAVGSDGGANQIGVAPGARWIGCRNMNQGTGSPTTYTECFQFFIAPTNLSGQNADPTKRPHVINNSWTCPASEGCAANTLQTIVQNTEAAGIFVEASAGNSGPSCSTVSDPPAIYSSAFSTGAVDINNTLAGFSSRGPVTADGSNRTKPEIVAPGVNVRSAVRTSDVAYSSLSGTSMAGPHVVGVVALLWSARPDLVRNIAATKQVLTSSANPSVTGGGTGCGGSSVVPNNNFGWGLVDALAAYNGSPTLTVAKAGSGTGTVTSSPAGINCGATCSAAFATGSSVTLTASVDAGSAFTGWGGDCSGTGTCTVTMNGSHTVTATFALPARTLSVTKAGAGAGTVTSSPAGINCGASCSAGFAEGSSVTLSASADAGSTFAGWSGACSGTGTCTVTMSADRSVTATFALQTRTLAVTKAGRGSGTVTSSPAGISCGASCSAAFALGSSVTLTASPNSGSRFSGWSGNCSGKTNTCTLTMSANRSAKATFALTCKVPQLKGKLLTQARRALIRANCTVGRVTGAYSRTVKKGRVISQRPAAKARRAAGVKVNLVVSRGKARRR
jgi:serine protease AprX